MAQNGTQGRSAVISDDGLYRYRLERVWSDTWPVVFVMLNPSTADAVQDDRTIGRCVAFAQRWGAGSLTVVNLYAYRATSPAALLDVADPVGPDNDAHLCNAVGGALLRGGAAVAAWGAWARTDRIAAVLRYPEMGSLYALGITKGGQPRHPLYVRGDVEPQRWPA